MNTKTKEFLHTLKFGIEIEGEYNEDYISQPNIHEYHSSRRNEGSSFSIGGDFTPERDGSLNCTKFCDSFNSELVSRPFSFDEAKSIFKTFKEFTGSDDYIGDRVNFNRYCGAHLHISSSKINLKDWLCWSATEPFLKLVKQRLTDAGFPKVVKHWTRGYANPVNNQSRFYSGDRCMEVNIATSIPTVEIRGMNFMGVTKVTDMYKIYEIVATTFAEVITSFQTDKIVRSNLNVDLADFKFKKYKKIIEI